MSDIRPDLTEIEERIAAARENLRELIEQAAAYSGAADEALMSERIAEQEEQLKLLTKQRDEIFRQKS
jgi:bacterioferritin (cytochrome b1)